MNRQLMQNIGQNYPESADGLLDCISVTVSCAFNRHGTLLAVGCTDGRIVIWDFLTRCITKTITAHAYPVIELNWSRNGHKLLSTSSDKTLAIWDVMSGKRELYLRFPSILLRAQLHPRIPNGDSFIVSPMHHCSILVNKEGYHTNIPLAEDGDANVVASFDSSGDHIYTGNSKGEILVYTYNDLELVASFRIRTALHGSAHISIRAFCFARYGGTFIVHTSDKAIRVFDHKKVLEAGRESAINEDVKFQDLVNKLLWKKCCISPDGEYICAGSTRQHALHIWEKSTGNLVKILYGVKGEVLLDLVWHPRQPVIASVAGGLVAVWAQSFIQNWSSFAPDFKELDENIIYEERESEFDLEDEDKPMDDGGGSCADADEEIDVTGVDKELSSDEEHIDYLTYIPVTPEVDKPEEDVDASLPWENSAETRTSRSVIMDDFGSERVNLENENLSVPEQNENEEPSKKPLPVSRKKKKNPLKRFRKLKTHASKLPKWDF